MMDGGITRRCGRRCAMSSRILCGMTMGGSFGTLLVLLLTSPPPAPSILGFRLGWKVLMLDRW